MKRVKIVLWLLMPILITSCLNEGDETIVLDEVNPIDKVIPVDIRGLLEESMPIYSGSTPPNIEGTFLVSVNELVSSSLTADDPGDIFNDLTLNFSNQDSKKNLLSYKEKQNDSSSSSDSVLIVGKGNDFTAYFTAKGISSGIKTKEATIISGTISSKGIVDFYYAFVMLEKGSDPENQLIDEGSYRVFMDRDGLAENSSWNKSTNISELKGSYILGTMQQSNRVNSSKTN
jgi:hypothetical protein